MATVTTLMPCEGSFDQHPASYEDLPASENPTAITGRSTIASAIEAVVPAPGRRRIFDVAPSNITSRKCRMTVTTLIIVANLMQMVSNGVGLFGGPAIAKEFGVTGVHANWIAASYPLAQGTFVLMSGRLGAVYGHKNMLLLGGAWFVACTIVNGFVPGFIAFNILRALSGIGGAFILPNGVAMIGITNPPGSARNVSYGFFGASAPIGGYLGGVLVGLFIEYSKMQWSFLLLALFTSAVLLPLWWLLPPESPVDKSGSVDWLGAALGTSALILFNFVWNQAPAVGWQHPYEIAGLILSLALLAAFVLWGRFVAAPIMPPHIFNRQLSVLLFVVLLNYMCIGTTIWYALSWLQNVRGQSVLTSALGFSPFVVCGTFAAVFAGWLVPRMAAQWVLAIGVAGAAAAALLIATMPVYETYWAQVFPAWIFMAFSPDLVYTAAQIIASNSVGRSEQGVAGSLIGTLNLFGCSLGLGFASTIETQVSRSRANRILGYRSALWFGFSIAVIALLLDVLFVRRSKDDREGWHDDDDFDIAHLNNNGEANATGVETISLNPRPEQVV